MAEEKKFNPAPPDKHADDPKQARKADAAGARRRVKAPDFKLIAPKYPLLV